MLSRNRTRLLLALLVLLGGLAPLGALAADDDQQGVVRCANLIYGESKTSVCFAEEFLTTLGATHIRTTRKFSPVRLDSEELFGHPFAVMTGEGKFILPPLQQENLRRYLTGGGFLVASAGCSSSDWQRGFRDAIKQTFPELELKRLELNHPVFHSVFDIDRLVTSKGTQAETFLEGLEIDGRLVLIFSPDGLNDTAKAGANCCCCGGNEIQNARNINVNILAYAVTH